MRTAPTPLLFSILFSLSAAASTPDGGTVAKAPEKLVAGEVVALSRSTIIPNWETTASAVSRNIGRECYPIAAEAMSQLKYFYEILEIAKTRVPKTDPIATDQAVRKADLDRLVDRVLKMPKSNKGCPDVPMPLHKGNPK